MKVKYAVIFEWAENNWAAYVPDLPGCITTGSILEETEGNIQKRKGARARAARKDRNSRDSGGAAVAPFCAIPQEAIRGHLQTLREYGETVPEPTSLAKEIEVSPAA